MSVCSTQLAPVSAARGAMSGRSGSICCSHYAKMSVPSIFRPRAARRSARMMLQTRCHPFPPDSCSPPDPAECHPTGDRFSLFLWFNLGPQQAGTLSVGLRYLRSPACFTHHRYVTCVQYLAEESFPYSQAPTSAASLQANVGPHCRLSHGEDHSDDEPCCETKTSGLLYTYFASLPTDSGVHRV